MFLLSGKRIAQNWKLLITCVLMPVIVYIILYQRLVEISSLGDYSGYTMQMLREMQDLVPIIFGIFLVLSYEIFYRRQRTALKELCQIYSNEVKSNCCDFIWLCILELIVLLELFYFMFRYLMDYNGWNEQLFLYVGKILLLCHGAVYLLAIVTGMALAYIARRLVSASILVLVLFVFSNGFLGLMMMLFFYRQEWARLMGIFSIWNRKTNTVEDCYYLWSAEAVHWYKIFFWIALAITFYALLAFRKKWKAIFPAGIAVCFLLAYLQPSGAAVLYDVQNSCDSWFYDQVYYKLLYKNNDMEDYLNQDYEEFCVNRYDMELQVDDVLSAHVVCVPEQKDLPQYQFTLYHGYKISSVTNEKGEKLDYVQDKDWVTVNSSGTLQNIQFTYSGYNPFFYATSQAIYLPANFEYYPQPGIHPVLVVTDGWEDYTTDLLQNSADFHVTVKVKGQYKVASNFIGEDRGNEGKYHIWNFSGNDKGVAFLGSPFLMEKEIDGVRVICSYLDYDEQTYHDSFTYLNSIGVETVGKTYLNVPFGQYPNHCIGEHFFLDYITGLGGNAYDYYIGQYEPEQEAVKDYYISDDGTIVWMN